MVISFRTHRFDASDPEVPDTFRGKDLAEWLSEHLSGWRSSVIAEDWGWAVTARKDGFSYVFGIYDHDLNDVTTLGPRWVMRLYNQRDRSKWFLKLLRNIPPVAHPVVAKELLELLSNEPDFLEIEASAL